MDEKGKKRVEQRRKNVGKERTEQGVGAME